jgi:hypothetical protein
LSKIPLTMPERQYLLRRLLADGIIDQEMVDSLTDSHLWDVPVIIGDREILALYERRDDAAIEVLSTQPATMQMSIINESASVPALAAVGVVETPPPSTVPTWRKANVRDLWAWALIGAGVVISLEIVSATLFAISGVVW